MTETTLFVCELCRFSAAEASRNGQSGGAYLIEQLRAELQQRHLETAVNLRPLRCMAGCAQPCNVSVAAPDKLTFVLSGLPPDTAAAAVADFCQQHVEAPQGRVPYYDRPVAVRSATAFVLPPLPAPQAVAG